VEITCRIYKPRRPRESPLYRLVEQHLEELLRSWPARFVRQHGPLRPVVERVLREFLKCGLLEHGFARLWCSQCRKSVLVAFSCRGRSFCPSCEKKKQLLWAEWLRDEVLLGVAHRHVVLTIPRLLRPLFRRRRELLGELARAGAEAVKELIRHASGDGDVRPGIVVAVATAGDLLQWHPHLHLITTDGGRSADGSWHTPAEWDSERLMRLFRERLLGILLDKRAISQELVRKLLAWRHPGFSAHVGDRVAAEDKKRLEDTAAYLVRGRRGAAGGRGPRPALQGGGQTRRSRRRTRACSRGPRRRRRPCPSALVREEEADPLGGVVLTIPRLLRPLFRRRPELLGELARAGAEAVKELVRHASGEGDARRGRGRQSRRPPAVASAPAHDWRRRRPKRRRLVAHEGAVGRRATPRWAETSRPSTRSSGSPA